MIQQNGVLRAVFMGTPDFAVPSLKALYDAGVHIPLVVTVPDKPAGRGLNFRPSAVKIAAEAMHIPVAQPKSLKDPSFLQQLTDLQADLFVVVAFRILPEVVFSIPRLGTFNLHASLLPDYRGAAPIQRALMNGETTTGVTTFLIQKGVDMGKILLQSRVEVSPDDTTGTLHDRLMYIGSELVVKTAFSLQKGLVAPISQPEGKFHKAPPITPEDLKLDFSKPAVDLHNQIRALSPRPGAWCKLGKKRLKILRTSVDTATPHESMDKPGTIYLPQKGDFPRMTAGNGSQLTLREVQSEGKKAMEADLWSRGVQLPVQVG